MISSVTLMASSVDLVMMGEPLCMMARLKYLCASSISASREQLEPPADSPKMVTLSGSPPNPPMFSCTHFRAIIWSMSPRFCASG